MSRESQHDLWWHNSLCQIEKEFCCEEPNVKPDKPRRFFSNLSGNPFIDSLLDLGISVLLSAWFLKSTCLSAIAGPGSKLIFLSIVFVHASEFVSLLASISFPYRLSSSQLPPTLSPSSKFAAVYVFTSSWLFLIPNWKSACSLLLS